MQQRTLNILQKLLSGDEYLTVKALAEEFNVSKKSIYNSVEEIDQFLKTNNVELLHRNKTKGFKINNYVTNKDIIYPAIMNSINTYEKEYRIQYQIVNLCSNVESITIDSLANTLMVSRNTVINDCNKIRDDIKKLGLTLISTPFKGISIEGDEKILRDTIVNIIYSNSKYESNLLQKFIKEINLNDVEYIILSLERSLSLQFTDDSYKLLQIYLFIALYRVKQGKIITKEKQEESVLLTREYDVARVIYDKYFSCYKENKYNNEVIALSKLLLSLKSIRKTNKEENDLFENWFEYQKAVNAFLSKISVIINIPLQEDNDLFYNLVAHIRSAYYRIRYEYPIENNIMISLSKEYKETSKLVKDHISILEDSLFIKFNEKELDYIIMYIGAYIQNNKTDIEKQHVEKVAILCSSGISTSWILKKQIESEFNISVVGIYSKRDLEYLNQNDEIQYIITTLPYIKTNKNHLVVNSLLNDEDRKNLTKIFLNKNRYDDIYNEIIKISTNYIPKENINNYKKEIQAILNKNVVTKDKAIRREPVLKELMSEEVILVNQVVTNREEAIRLGGSLLLKQDLIEEKYIDAMIENVLENGPYIVLAPQIAIPHARVEYGSKGIGFSIMTLKEPIPFGHSVNDPVKLVVCLCAIDHQSHLLALSELVDILGNEVKLQGILNATTKQEILEIINEEVCL